MSAFPSIFPSVLGTSTLVIDQTKAPTDPPKPKDPAKRPYSMPFAFSGQFPGYGVFPTGLTPYIAWAIRRYPMTVKVHARLTKPVLAGSRSIEVEDDAGSVDQADKIKKAAESDLLPILARAMAGAMEAPSFGHWLQEVIWGDREGRISPLDVRSVLPSEGVIHVDEFRRFSGYEVGGEFRDARYGFLSVNDPHIDPVLGYSYSANALTTWFRATKSAENSDALERKASGIQMFLHIMQGVEIIDDNGAAVDITSVLTTIMNAAIQGKSAVLPDMAFPKEAIQVNPELAKIPLTRLDKFDWGNQGPAMEASLSRKRDLDVDLCSAWGVPERAVMESEHGSRADAEAHSDVVLCISENFHATACSQWDEQITRRWLEANFPDTKVKIRTVPSPLSDPQQAFLQEFAKTLASSTNVDPEIRANADIRKLMERIEVPVVSEDEAKANLAQLEAKQQQAQQDKMDAMKASKNGNGNRITALE